MGKQRGNACLAGQSLTIGTACAGHGEVRKEAKYYVASFFENFACAGHGEVRKEAKYYVASFFENF